MTPERWQQITSVFHAALARDDRSRGAFLDSACAIDKDLRAEVEAMLAAHRDAGQFGDSPVVPHGELGPTLATADRAMPIAGEGATLPPHADTGSVDRRRRHPFFWIACVASVALAAAFAYGASLLVLHGGAPPAFGWDEAFQNGEWVVTRVDPAGPAAGLVEVGDRIVSMNGVPPAGRRPGTRPPRRELSIGDAYRLAVERQGERLEPMLTVGEGPRNLTGGVSFFLLNVVWCGVGILIGLARPQHPVARLACCAAVMTGMNGLNGLIRVGPLFHPMHVVVGSHFFCRFPTGRPVVGLWKWILVLMYAVGLVPFALNAWMQGTRLVAGVPAVSSLLSNHTALFELRGPLPLYVFYTSLIVMVAAAVRNYRTLVDEDERRRVRWVVYGTIVGFALQIVWSAAEIVVGAGAAAPLGPAANMLTAAIPLSVAYVVVKHRVFDISVVVRRGMQYLLARRALQALTAVPALVLVSTIVTNRDQTITQIADRSTAYLYWIGAAGLTLRYRRPVGVWLDRRFFREAYDRERLLLELLDDLGGVESMTEVSRLVNTSLESAFHPRTVHLWHRSPEKLELGYSSNPDLTTRDLPSRRRLLAWLEVHRRVVGVPLPEEAALPRSDARWLAGLGVTMIVPVIDSAERLAGVWLLGEKKSEEPYSANDRRLLEALAKQTAFVSENLRLKEQVGEEQRIRRDVLARLDERHASLLKECPSCGACFDAAAERCDRDGHTLVLSLPVGRTIDGRYRLDQLIGKGGMGAVYEARDVQLERAVAIKIMIGRSFGDQRSIRRSRREARATAQLNHRNIVTVYDVGSLEADGAYLVMERIHGVTLRSELQRAGSLSPADTADWFEQMLDGIAAAHDQGIVHRDLKPENIIGLRKDPQSLVVKILDFGLAKLDPETTLATGTLTTDGAVMGTLGYMSPEQLLGQAVDHRTDIFAVGVMLAETLTGKRTFQGDVYGEFVQAALHGEYHLPDSLPGHRVIDDVLQRCLAKSPHDRFASTAELRRALIPALRA